MSSIDTKLLLKVKEKNGEIKWVHFCYIETEIYMQFLDAAVYEEEDGLNGFLSDWCVKDFHILLHMDSPEDLQNLKELIKTHYKDKYPEIYRDTPTDRQGWTRIWVTENMRKVVQNSGKES